jgi:RND family efflux transporter MFP subunit
MSIYHCPSSIFIKSTPFILLAFLMGCSEPPIEEKVIRPVKSILVEAHHAGVVRNLPGKVRAADKVDLAFQVSGRMTHMDVLSGQRVIKNTVLARLDSRDYDSNVKAARAEYNRAQSDFLRAKELVAKNLVSKSDFDNKRAQRDIAETKVEKSAKALEDTQLKAPFAGLVTTRYVTNFQDVQAKQPIVSLQNISSLEVVVHVPENAIPKNLTANQLDEVEAFASFEGVRDKQFELSIKEFEGEADPITQLFTLVWEMDYPESLSIYPGMSVAVELVLPVKTEDSTLMLPSTSVFADQSGGDAQFVWVIDLETLQVHRQEVIIGALRADKIEIISGVDVGMQVVTAGVNYLSEGDVVRLITDSRGV